MRFRRLPKPGVVPEAVILRQVRDYLRATGWFVYRNQQSMGSHRGLSDLTAVRKGRAVWIETKTARGVLSPHQERFKTDIQAQGFEFWTVRSLDDLENCLLQKE